MQKGFKIIDYTPLLTKSAGVEALLFARELLHVIVGAGGVTVFGVSLAVSGNQAKPFHQDKYTGTAAHLRVRLQRAGPLVHCSSFDLGVGRHPFIPANPPHHPHPPPQGRLARGL